jgi:hypothetical protein
VAPAGEENPGEEDTRHENSPLASAAALSSASDAWPVRAARTPSVESLGTPTTYEMRPNQLPARMDSARDHNDTLVDVHAAADAQPLEPRPLLTVSQTTTEVPPRAFPPACRWEVPRARSGTPLRPSAAARRGPTPPQGEPLSAGHLRRRLVCGRAECGRARVVRG